MNPGEVFIVTWPDIPDKVVAVSRAADGTDAVLESTPSFLSIFGSLDIFQQKLIVAMDVLHLKVDIDGSGDTV